VIHPEVDIGENCILFQQVTIVTRGSGIPKIEGHVDIGAAAKILAQSR
jgi:serine O-acetyltransferase